jgi:hypothetical protein
MGNIRTCCQKASIHKNLSLLSTNKKFPLNPLNVNKLRMMEYLLELKFIFLKEGKAVKGGCHK